MTMAASLPSPRVIFVSSTMVVRPRCSGVALRAHRIALRHRRKEIGLALDRRGVAAFRQIGERELRARGIADRHHDAAMQHAAAVAHVLVHHELGLHAIGRRDG